MILSSKGTIHMRQTSFASILLFSTCLLAIASPKGSEPSIVIDAPAPNARLTGLVEVRGWAIKSATATASDSVQSVTVLIDGNQVGTATYGTAWADVCTGFRGRAACPNAGWSYNLDVDAFGQGNHVMKVVALDSAGNSSSNEVSFTTTSSLVPSVIVDVPAPGAILKGKVAIDGWAIENVEAAGREAVQAVTIFVDGNQIGTANYGIARPDVCDLLPGRLGCPNVGWSYSLDVDALPSGSHVLKVAALNTAGKTSFTKVYFTAGALVVPSETGDVPAPSATSTAPAPSVTVDAPTSGATLSGTIAIRGWAMEKKGDSGFEPVRSVAIFVDGNQIGTATYGTARPDVCAVFPGRSDCPGVGWVYDLDVSAVLEGSHVVKIVATDTSGRSSSSERTFLK
jgi:hypothetical protein